MCPQVKPFQQRCASCDFCPCLGPGCGPRCECSCNAMCRLRRETTCALTAGVLSPGRWYVAIDAPGPFTLEVAKVAAMVLRPAARPFRRTVFAVGAPAGAGAFGASSTSEGVTFSDYYFYDPEPQESLRVQIELLRTGSGGAWVDVYVRFGEWPTVGQYDAAMRCDPDMQPSARFVLQPDRLINERLHVLVIGGGHSWAQYEISSRVAPSLPFLVAISLAMTVICGAGAALIRIIVRRRRQAAEAEVKPITAAGQPVRFGYGGV